MSGTTDAGRLLVRIEATTAQLRQQLQAAEQQVAGTAAKIDNQLKQADKAFSRLEEASKATQQAVAGLAARLGPIGGALSALGTGGAAAAAGLGVMGAGLVSIAKAGDTANATLARLASATGSLQAAQTAYEGLFRLSQQTGVAVEESAGAFSRFAVAAKEIGATNDQVLQLVGGLQRAAIVAGSSGQETAAAMGQLAQALASGKLQGDELRSVLENMPQLAQALAREMGTNIGALRKMGEEGKLTADIVFPALLRASEKIGAEFDKMPMTIGRAAGALSASGQNFGAQLDHALGLSRGIADALKAAADALTGLQGSILPTQQQAAETALAAARARVAALRGGPAALPAAPEPEPRTAEERRARTPIPGRDPFDTTRQRFATPPGPRDASQDRARELAEAEEAERQAQQRLAAILERGSEQIQMQEEQAARARVESTRRTAAERYKELSAGWDKERKLREDAQKSLDAINANETAGNITAEQAAKDRAAVNRDLANSLKSLAEAAGKESEEARKAAEKRAEVLGTLDRQIAVQEEALRAAQSGIEASRDAAIALEIEERVRAAGIPTIDKRTDAERRAAEAIGNSVRKLDNLKVATEKADEQAKKAKEFYERSWNALADIPERAIDRLGDALVQAFVMGESAAVNFGNVTRGILASVVGDLAKLAVINPILNSLFVGTNGPRPTLAGAFGMGGAGGGLGLGDVLGLSSLIPKDGLLGSLGITGAGGLLSTPLWAGPAVAIEPSIAMGVGGYMAPSSVTLGGLLGGAGAGFGAGMLLNNLIGGNQTGGMVGSGLGGLAGAAIGSLIPGVGTLIGGLIGGAAGGGLGGLFGPGPSVQGYGFRLQSAGYGPDGAPTNAMANSLLPIDRTFYNDSGAQMFQAADQLVAATNAYLAARGLTVGGVSIVGGNKNGADYSSADAGNLNEAFQRLRFGAANDNALAAALTGKTFSDLGGLQQFVEGFASVRDTIKALTETPAQKLARQLEEIGKQFDDLSAKAKEYGLSEEGLAEARQKALDAVKGQENREGQAIRAYLDRLSTNDPTAAPTDRFAAAQGIFGADLAAAQAGDASALARITSSADTLLGAGRAAYASGPQFAALRSMVVSSLENLPAMRGLPASQQPIDMVPLIDELAALKMQVADLREELRTARLKAAA